MRLNFSNVSRLSSLPLIIFAGSLVLEGSRQVYVDIVSTAAGTELSFWGAEAYQPTEAVIARTGSNLQQLDHFPPVAPGHMAQQAYFLSWQGFFADDIEQRLAFNEQAAAKQYQSMMLRPAYRQGWAEVIEYASRTRGGAKMLDEAYTRIAALQPALN
ncbi:MAG: hypothetical protein ABJN62_19420 [Halioglobus sp.]